MAIELWAGVIFPYSVMVEACFYDGLAQKRKPRKKAPAEHSQGLTYESRVAERSQGEHRQERKRELCHLKAWPEI